jgi:NTE family protein
MTDPTPTFPRFALALSGGGAAGLGHIPVLETLDEAGLRPEAIAGTSMGAILGACYASGLSGAQIRAHTLDLLSDIPALGKRMVRGAKWADLGLGLFLDPEHILRCVLPEDVPERIEDLAIPFTAVATDFYLQKEIRFTEGPLRPALAASMAIPGVFRPVAVDGRVHVDGGVCNVLPIEALPRDCPVIAVDTVTYPLDRESTDIPSPMMASLGAMRIMMRALLERQLDDRKPFALLRPPCSKFAALDFMRAEDILEAADPIREDTGEAIAGLRTDGK